MQAQTKDREYDWKSYNQRRAQISLRIDRTDKQALDTALQNRGETVSELLMAYLRPIITEGTPEGQRAHEIISTAVQQSIAWNKAQHNGGYGDTTPAIDANGNPIASEDWRTPDVQVRPRITKGGDRVHYHVVIQRAGMTRQDAIRNYVSRLMDVWSDMPANDRESLLAELANPEQHRFIMGFANMRHWTRFDAAHEMNHHFSTYVQPNIADAADDDERAFCEWASLYLSTAWAKAKRSKSDLITLYEGQPTDAGVLFTMDFRHYATRSDAENVAAWAGVWLNEYRQIRKGTTHEGAISELIDQSIRVIPMRFTEG